MNPSPLNGTVYDFIIAGAGCAGLSLAVHMTREPFFADKKILLVDQATKKSNDRTWCFWETQPGPFESIVYHRWPEAWFHSNEYSRLLTLDPYEYKLIRGIDFYEYCQNEISKHNNISWLTGTVQSVNETNDSANVVVDGIEYKGGHLFNSLMLTQPVPKKGEYFLLQHFKGWIIETPSPVFDPQKATLMDFRVDQQHGTTFVYVMPFTPTRALVEYTLFSEKLLTADQYDAGLQTYIREYIGAAYQVKEEEFGVIPMTTSDFLTPGTRITPIGTAGGQTKASSGYTFRFIQKHSAAIVHSLIHKGSAKLSSTPGKYRFYDKTLLHILQHKKLPGHKIFSDLFRHNHPAHILQFLDNESSLLTDLRVISSLPKWEFLKAALRIW